MKNVLECEKKSSKILWSNWHRFIKKENTSIPQKTKFAGKLEEDNGATMFFIAEKQQKTILNFSLDSLIVTEWYK